MSDGGPKKRTSPGFHFIAGLGSGVASAFLLQPADLLKTRVQQTQASSLRAAFRDVVHGPRPIRTLWRGTTPSVIRTGLGSALYFGMLNQMRQSVARMSSGPHAALSRTGGSPHSSSALPKLSNVANLSTGALARVAAGFLMNPVAVLKVRYESTQYAYTSLASAARDVVAREGLRGFFTGVGATAVRDAPYAGLYVVIYEQAKTRLGASLSVVSRGAAAPTSAAATTAAAPEGTSPPPLPPHMTAMSTSATINFVSGVVAAVSATAMTNPFDAIKTRLQLAPGRYRNMMQAARTMLREEGVRSMFSGLSLRIGRKALSSALTWTVYEELIRRAETALV